MYMLCPSRINYMTMQEQCPSIFPERWKVCYPSKFATPYPGMRTTWASLKQFWALDAIFWPIDKNIYSAN